VNAFLAAALARVVRAAQPIPAVAAASVLHSAAVGGSVLKQKKKWSSEGVCVCAWSNSQ